jgi:hypothetical protein
MLPPRCVHSPATGQWALLTARTPWLAPEVATARVTSWAARLALELMLDVGARRHDVHVLGDQHICNEVTSDGESIRRICWRPHKTLRTINKLLKVKILPEFQDALDAMKRPSGVLNFLTTDGKPFASAAAFGNKFAD